MRKINIVIATHQDWDAIYVDGILKNEDHTLYACDLVDSLLEETPCCIETIEMKSVDEKWWYDKNDLDGYPSKIEDVVFEKE